MLDVMEKNGCTVSKDIDAMYMTLAMEVLKQERENNCKLQLFGSVDEFSNIPVFIITLDTLGLGDKKLKYGIQQDMGNGFLYLVREDISDA